MSTTSIPAIGDILPNAAVTRADAADQTKAVRLHDAIGPEGALVYFMRTSSCPICQQHLRTMVRMVQAGELSGLPVVVVVPGRPSDAEKIQQRFGAQLTIVSSTAAHAAMGLFVKVGLQQSGTFIVDRNGRVTSQRVATMPTQGFNKEEATRAAAVLTGVSAT